MKKIVFLFLFLGCFSGFSQTIEDVEAERNQHQECLDMGENIAGCSVGYYNRMNVMLDRVFKSVRERSTSEQKGKLKKDQLLWLNKKNAYFTKVYNDSREELGSDESEDFRMIVNSKRADFVAERIIELLKQE